MSLLEAVVNGTPRPPRIALVTSQPLRSNVVIAAFDGRLEEALDWPPEIRERVTIFLLQ